jgi:hypothetical protein
LKQLTTENWDSTQDQIDGYLARDRFDVLNLCVKSLAEQVSLSKTVLEPSIEQAMYVYQLSWTAGFAQRRKYIPEGHVQRFVNELYAGPLRYGGRIRRDELICSYDDERHGKFRFYGDLAVFLTGKETPLVEAEYLMERWDIRFSGVAMMVAALAFDDKSGLDAVAALMDKREPLNRHQVLGSYTF